MYLKMMKKHQIVDHQVVSLSACLGKEVSSLEVEVVKC